jgi:hypothetical protein
MNDPLDLADDVLASLRRHVTAALDTPSLWQNGILYDVTIQGYVAPRVTADCPVEQPAPEIIEQSPNAPYDERLARRCRLGAQPRGAWSVAISSPYFRPLMSSGNCTLTGHSDTYETMPTWQKVYDRMIGYEIYLMRQRIERERELAANLAALPRFAVGQTIRDIRVNWTAYSTAQVVAVAPTEHPECVRLSLTKRGSAKRWIAHLPAALLLQKTEHA